MNIIVKTLITVFLVMFVPASLLFVWIKFSSPDYKFQKIGCETAKTVTIDTSANKHYLKNSLELHIGGWVSNGTVTIDGDFYRNEKPITFGVDGSEVARSYYGEWYEDKFEMNITPSEGAVCHLRISYH